MQMPREEVSLVWKLIADMILISTYLFIIYATYTYHLGYKKNILARGRGKMSDTYCAYKQSQSLALVPIPGAESITAPSWVVSQLLGRPLCGLIGSILQTYQAQVCKIHRCDKSVNSRWF